MTVHTAPGLTVIVPAYNAEATIGDCLAAINASVRRPDTLIVYDDGATDSTGAIARAAGATVIRNDGRPRGPGIGRTIAAGTTEAGVIVFIDADVVVRADAIGQIEAAIRDVPGVAAAFGSYDDQPTSQRAPALYANLRHHVVHQRSNTDAETFWAGIGGVDRVAFQSIGGFSPRYHQPSIEDIELGVRLRQHSFGIRLVPTAQGTHCKDWGLIQLWQTDIFRRAIPWIELILSGATPASGLNMALSERVSAILAHLVVLGLGLLPFGVMAALPLTLALLAYIVINRDLLGLIALRGPVKALAGLGLHLAYHVYAAQVFAWMLLRHRMGNVQAIARRRTSQR